MNYELIIEEKCISDLKRCKKRRLDLNKFSEVADLLATGEPLPKKYSDHKLNNDKNYKNVRECHIERDWLLIYRREGVTIRCIRTGTHDELKV